jgi:lipopolysaccharide export system protein LptA
MIQGERIVTGEKAIFYNDDQKIIVTGNTVMQDGDNIIKGEKTVVFMKENRGIVEGGPGGRVRATIYPEETKNKESN